MPERTPPDPVEPIRRQIGRLRRRRNVHELTRALALLVALSAAAGTSLVLLAVRAGPRVFAAGAWTAATAALLGALRIVAGTRRRWLARERAPRWIDRQAGLDGRLATLVELDRRGALPAESFFLPLLVDENRRRLPSWQPAVLVPRGVPGRAAGAALGAMAALLLALLLAPALAPPPPEMFYGDGVPEGAGVRVAIPGRAMMAPARARRGGERLAPPPSRSIAAELQDRIRRRLFGPERELAREAMARMADGARRSSRDEPDPGDAERKWEVARSGASPADAGAQERAATAGQEQGENDEGHAGRPDRERHPVADAAAGTGDAARGAGTATDPRLLGPATDPRGGRETFDLPIVARVRSLGGGPRPPAGEGPPAAPDARPELGAGQRRDAPIARMDVPPAYEDVVRRVFAHRGGDATP